MDPQPVMINAVIIVEDQGSGSEQDLAANFVAQFSADPQLIISITINEQLLRAKIQQPLDLDVSASAEQRQAAAEDCAAQLAVDSIYYWEEVDEQGELRQQGPKTTFTALDHSAAEQE